MTITEYINLVINTKQDVFCKEELFIDEDFDATDLLKLCSNDLPIGRLRLAWDMIVSAVAEKFKNSEMVDFFPKEVIDFLIENKIALGGLSHIRLPKEYLRRIYEKDNRYWEALKNI